MTDGQQASALAILIVGLAFVVVVALSGCTTAHNDGLGNTRALSDRVGRTVGNGR